ncbi:uncharacterized protein LOC122006221 [Zingiber officinale]|uniref:Uncharacterized protein n=1 Tax=Zingiber officinale TaxID=94328 RepID=A0A8J5KR96_ZINOF|nr:uncharacterized protein LOC122006221 [Zingiber officinale]KAG6490174.1 hypothetical protein ZIOFF_051459 [Zingiber officinale]
MKPTCAFVSPDGIFQKEGGGGETAAEAVAVGSGRSSGATASIRSVKQKPPFRIAKDDSKPLLRDPILRSDPIETEQAVLRLPPLPRRDS